MRFLEAFTWMKQFFDPFHLSLLFPKKAMIQERTVQRVPERASFVLSQFSFYLCNYMGFLVNQ